MIKTDARATLDEAAGIISAGGIVAYRTDTFYGLGADPLNRDAVRSIRSLKGREEAKPILLLISDEGELARFLISRSEAFQRLAQRHWPGPLTLIGLARPEIPDELTAGTGTIGVRLPDDERVRKLVRICGGALTATSANLSGSLPARSAEEVQTYFPDEIALIIDSGEVTVAEPSTVVDVSDKGPRIIREGIIKREHLGIKDNPFSS
jgi:L-threonylcarbamoyladenylate synthase